MTTESTEFAGEHLGNGKRRAEEKFQSVGFPFAAEAIGCVPADAHFDASLDDIGDRGANADEDAARVVVAKEIENQRCSQKHHCGYEGPCFRSGGKLPRGEPFVSVEIKKFTTERGSGIDSAQGPGGVAFGEAGEKRLFGALLPRARRDE